MAKIVKLISKNCGNIKPDSVEDYVNAGGYTGLRKAMEMQPSEIIEEVKNHVLWEEV